MIRIIFLIRIILYPLTQKQPRCGAAAQEHDPWRRQVPVRVHQLHRPGHRQQRRGGEEGRGREGESAAVVPGSSGALFPCQDNYDGWLCQLIKGCDPKLVETILNEVIPRGSTGVSWADVAGQDKAKVTATQY